MGVKRVFDAAQSRNGGHTTGAALCLRKSALPKAASFTSCGDYPGLDGLR